MESTGRAEQVVAALGQEVGPMNLRIVEEPVTGGVGQSTVPLPPPVSMSAATPDRAAHVVDVGGSQSTRSTTRATIDPSTSTAPVRRTMAAPTASKGQESVPRLITSARVGKIASAGEAQGSDPRKSAAPKT